MGLYSELLPKEKILRHLEPYNRILLITCPGCACESIAYAKDLPCRSLQSGENMEENAKAVHLVRDYWNEKLKDKKVTNLTIAFLCELFEKEKKKILEMALSNDAILVLACSSGCVGVHDIIHEQDLDIPLIPMMKTIGTFVFHLIPDSKGHYSVIEKDSARVILFKENESAHL